MMTTVLFALGIFALAFAGMAVGVIFSNRCIKGSCGGLSNLEGAEDCSACGGCSVSEIKENQREQVTAANSCAGEEEK
ncbi:MAG: (Na+)-NQR maturation NqrM [Planctomycetes bacterium]|nr:(Na+)-NQR maturation NqrM [Planctomycetota bacterium]MCH9727944.1 (Na+)-NQR maturation NqrM [Planctomycetota bacterium]MCH9778379.1 (Na+)-NQR maturation NqrM [Planctomycetota bacterium]MCH9791931.1 (Na+)-NQR maturation NqrM [Planctomycetota bacterium]MDF1742898.1 (Na+)-NQR maturation NqrM [Gimesia sp.]